MINHLTVMVINAMNNEYDANMIKHYPISKIQKRFILKKPLKLILIFLIPFILIFLIPALTATLIGDQYDDKADYLAMESHITSEMKQNHVPGLSIVIFKDQKTLYSKGFGVKSTQTGEPVDEDTVFQGASFSKTLTAYAALMLVERGKLSLDEPLRKYLKKEYLPNSKAAGMISLRMVLTHTSGLSNDSDGNDRRIYYQPGQVFSYSGAGFRYLQQVMEDITGMPFAEFMEEELIQPLQMNSSTFVYQEKLAHRVAIGHEAKTPHRNFKKDANAAYSLLTTPSDMARFIKETFDPTLLNPETVSLMLHPRVKWARNIYWGLGFGILKSPQEDYFWHWGNNYYYCSIMITGKESKNGVIIMTNANTGMKLAGRLAVKVMNDYCREPGSSGSLEPKTFDFLL
jgi:CubicO group peptidase (beta-lactamase class C family)